MAAQFGMPFTRANRTPAVPSTSQPTTRAARNPPSVLAIGLILTSVLPAPFAWSDGPPPNLAKLAAHRETETEAERNEYTYRQTVTIEELDDKGGARGAYREVRDIVFSPKHDRTEELVGIPRNTLKLLLLTEEDFRDVR